VLCCSRGRRPRLQCFLDSLRTVPTTCETAKIVWNAGLFKKNEVRGYKTAGTQSLRSVVLPLNGNKIKRKQDCFDKKTRNDSLMVFTHAVERNDGLQLLDVKRRTR
jgi:hypothetical protein